MVKRVALSAGEITMAYFDEGLDLQVETKSDDSPVTQADREAEAFIQKALKEILPEVLVVGEEAFALGHAPDVQGAEYFWLVDALDGTKEFIEGGGEFTVNIGLIHHGVPILGVVYAPAKGMLYAGCGEGTATRWLEENDQEKPIAVRQAPRAGLTVVASKSHGDASRQEKFLEGFKIEKIIKRGSSLKICAIAGGKADLYPRFGKTCEWDTAAADAVLRSAGGSIRDCQGRPLVYGGTDPHWYNPEFIASAFDWFSEPL